MFYAILLVSSTLVQAVPNTTTISFLLMVASGSSPDFSTLVPAVDQTLEEINMEFSFAMNYKTNHNKVSLIKVQDSRKYNPTNSAMQQELSSSSTMKWWLALPNQWQ